VEKAIFEKKELLESKLFCGKEDLVAADLEEGVYYTREEAMAQVVAYGMKTIR